jgi:hypothetical protein
MKQENRNQDRGSKERTASTPGRHCPFVADPFDECFIAGINSQNIDEAIHYCGNNYKECKIYRRATRQIGRIPE